MQVQGFRVPVQLLQAGTCIRKADSFVYRGSGLHARPIIRDSKNQFVLVTLRADLQVAALRPRVEAMSDRVFREWLQDQVGDSRIQAFRFDGERDSQAIAESDLLDVEIPPEHIELFLE